MAKIISQICFESYSQFDDIGDLKRLELVLNGLDDEALMIKLEKKRKNGRNDYPVRVMWNLIIAMKVFQHKSVESFRKGLSRNKQLREICGLTDGIPRKHLVPTSGAFSRFIRLLKSEQEEVDKLFASLVEKLYEELPGFGELIAGDGKYIDSYSKSPYSKPNPKAGDRADNDAKCSIKEYHYTGSDGKNHTKKETHYGFKAHIVCDTRTELPIAFSITAANVDERKAMADILEVFSDAQKQRAYAIMMDRGYDSTKLIKQVKSKEIIPIIDIRNCWRDGEETKQYKDTDIVYDYAGHVYYVDDAGNKHKKLYKGYDSKKKCLRYEYGGKIDRIYTSYDERIFLPVARDSKKFKKLYKMRTSIERLNGRLDRDFMFEDHCLRGLAKTKLMVSLSFIVMNAMALGKIKEGISQGLAAHTKAA
jgi:hypothetical protein